MFYWLLIWLIEKSLLVSFWPLGSPSWCRALGPTPSLYVPGTGTRVPILQNIHVQKCVQSLLRKVQRGLWKPGAQQRKSVAQFSGALEHKKITMRTGKKVCRSKKSLLTLFSSFIAFSFSLSLQARSGCFSRVTSFFPRQTGLFVF